MMFPGPVKSGAGILQVHSSGACALDEPGQTSVRILCKVLESSLREMSIRNFAVSGNRSTLIRRFDIR